MFIVPILRAGKEGLPIFSSPCWLSHGCPVASLSQRRCWRMQSLRRVSRDQARDKVGCLHHPPTASHCQVSVLIRFQRLPVGCSPNSLSWTHFTEWGLNSSERKSKITAALRDSSGGNCVLLVVMFTGQGFRGIGRWANVLLDLSENSLSHFHFQPPKRVKWILCAVYRKVKSGLATEKSSNSSQPLLPWVTFLLSRLLTLFWNRLFTKPRACSWVALIWVL